MLLAHTLDYGRRPGRVHDGLVQPPIRPLPAPTFLGWTPDEWSAAAAVTTVVIAVAAAIFAYRQVGEARRLRTEQAEPYVAIFAESVSGVSEQLVDLVVMNFGSTAAFDVKVLANPHLERSSNQDGGSEPVVLPNVIRTLVPGQQWRTYFDHGPSRAKTSLPDMYEVTVTFTSQHGKKKTEHSYRFTLDLASFKVRHHVTQYGVHHAAKALRDMRTTFDKWSEGIGRNKGLTVYSRDGDKRDQDRQDDLAQYRRQHIEDSMLRPRSDDDSAAPSTSKTED